MAAGLIFPAVLMGVFLVYSLYVMKKRKTAMPESTRMFFERTGYRYADIINQPLEAHINYGVELMRGARKGYRIHMIRNFHGIPVHNVQEYKTETGLTGSTTSSSYGWSVPLPQQPRILLQIAEKSLRGFRKGLNEAFSNSERCWNQQYQHEVQTGDPEFDSRFNVYSDNPAAAYQALGAPGLKPLLLQCTEVDLTVYPDQIRIADPSQKNITAVMGGMVGGMALATNPAKMMELAIPIHDHMAQLLATTYQATA